jgi:imidazolonepropionase
MSKILIKNIKQLVGIDQQNISKKSGSEMKQLEILEDAWLAIEDDKILDFGTMQNWPGITDWSNLEIIDAEGKCVLPTWCDSHTHIVYAGSREQEFVDRINGLTYQEIASRGGGILNSAQKLATVSEQELFDNAMQRINEVISQGTGAIEIKSGYGLTLESELKMLRVIKRIKENCDVEVKATFLGAHAVPTKFQGKKSEYINLIINEMLPAIAEEKLADYCDVFCEENYFSKEETIKILEAGKAYGLIPKVHANQLSFNGGVQAGVQVGAISVDHLEYVDNEEIESLLKSNTMPTILPGAAYFLSLPLPPARKMIDAGLPIAVASDFNPGSSPTGNMNLMVSMLCINYKLNPEEAINAATINSAFAMNLNDQYGTISIGKTASVFITSNIPNYQFIPYSFGSNLIETVILKGKIVKK